MGWKWAPWIATCTAQLLWQEGQRQAGLGGAATYATVWVDDSLVAGPARQVRAVQAATRAVCRRVGAEVKAWQDPSPTFTYVGLEWDLCRKRARLAAAFLEAFAADAAQLAAESATFGACWQALGAAVWMCYVLNLPYAALAGPLADVADAVAANVSREAAWAPARAVAPRLVALAAWAASPAGYVGLRPVPRERVVVATDASDVGLGWVVNGSATAVPFARPIASTGVQRAEALAVCAAVRTVAEQAEPGTEIVVVSDNLGLVWRLARWAAPPSLADTVVHLWRICADARVLLRVGWIATAANPADAPSRSPVAFAAAPVAGWDPAALEAAAWFPPAAGTVVPQHIPGFA